MSGGLPTISFICAILLTVFIPTRHIRENIANFSLVTCLIGCNIVHGIDTIIWSGNVNIHIPVWCDIVTKLLLGATLALPAACLCISRHLELVSSTRKISLSANAKRKTFLIDISLCYILPIIYMSLHAIGQDHRFDLVKDFGCSASIDPSIPALIIIWLPPLIICITSLIISALTIYNSCWLLSGSFPSHLSSRSPMPESLFICRLITSIFTTSVFVITICFSMFGRALKPWISWSSVHAHFYDIDVKKSQDEITIVQLSWWAIPIISIVYMLLSVTIGEETRETVQRIWKRISRRRTPQKPLLIMRARNNKSQPEIIPRSPSFITPRPPPQKIELKSGWDDMIDFPTKARTKPKPKLQIPSHAETSYPSPSKSSNCHEDEAFITATLSYLVSPTAHTLGLPTPVVPPESSFLSLQTPQKAEHAVLPPRRPIPARIEPPRELDVTTASDSRCIADDAESTISSIWTAPWPQPPSSVDSSHYSSRSLSSSPTPSGGTFGCPHNPSIIPPELQRRPSGGSNVVLVPDPRVSSLPRSQQRERRPGVRDMNKGRTRDGFGHAPGEVIYMTTVNESV